MTSALTLTGARIRRSYVAAALALSMVSGLAPAAQAVGRMVSVIVMSDDAGRAANLTHEANGQVGYALPIIGGVSARVPASALPELRQRATVVPDRAMHLTGASYGDGLVSAYPTEVGAPELWSQGDTGKGVAVAMIDTGVANVPDLRGRVVATANLTRERTPFDTYGHGTFQAGIIAGNGASSDGRYTGIAPQAKLVSVKVADSSGDTSLGQVLAGVQVVDLAADRFNVRVALLAMSDDSPLPPDIDPLTLALRRLWAHGIVVVVPSGNSGPDAGTVSSPGEDPVLLTSGSVNDQGTSSVNDDSVSDFSSRGPTRWGDLKPDIAAPGEHLVSLRAPGSTVDVQNPSARVEDAYFKGSGTSMSAAVTAGAAALVLNAHPDYSPDVVKAVFMATASGVFDGDVASVGAGIVNAADAVSVDTSDLNLPDQPNVDGEDNGDGNNGDHGNNGNNGDHGMTWVKDGGMWRWVSRSWNGRSWNDDEWDSLMSDARSWAARSWNSRSWDSRSWDSRTWASRTWAARSWAARTWNSRSWDGRTWAGRTWSSRSWAGRTWSSRTWSSRTWSADEWSSRSWSSRTWSSRTWSSRSWTSRTWSSRTWSDVEWSARTWSSRSWSSRSWSSVDWS